MSVNERLLEKAKSVSEPQFLQNMEEFHFSQQPAEMERQLEFLDFSNGEATVNCCLTFNAVMAHESINTHSYLLRTPSKPNLKTG